MSAKREELLGKLEDYYRSCGWPVERARDGTVRAAGPGGVTWIGMAVVEEDLTDGLEERLVKLSEVRMPSGGERCPLELLPAEECAGELRAVLGRLRLAGRVSVYSLAA